MVEPPFLNVGQVGEHGSTTRAHWADGDECWSKNCCRNERRWLHDRVRELEQQLRRRTVVLAGALALSGLLGSFTILSFYGSGRATVSPAVAPSSGRPSSSPAMMWKGEQASQIERSQEWAMGEEQIELIAALHYEAQKMQAPIGQLTTTSGEAEGSEATKPETSARGEVHGQGDEAVARDWSPASHQAVVSASVKQDGSRAARASERSLYAAKDFVNLRTAPNNSAEVLTVVARGDLVRQTGRNLGWLQVEYSNRSASSISGWVYGSYLRRVESSGRQPRP